MKTFSILVILSLVTASGLNAAVVQYGDQDVLGTTSYGSSPTAGATLEGLAPGAVTVAGLITGHVYPFAPSVGDFPGTDEIYVGSTQTASHDGYSVSSPRINGPQNLSLDYSSAVPSGHTITTLTLGIAADDFQFPTFGQAFTASINGVPNAPLTALLNGLNQGGPVVQFVTIGLDPSLLSPSEVLNVTIDEGGDGGDGWAVDFLTVGVTTTTATVPETSTCLVGLAMLLPFAIQRIRHLRRG